MFRSTATRTLKLTLVSKQLPRFPNCNPSHQVPSTAAAAHLATTAPLQKGSSKPAGATISSSSGFDFTDHFATLEADITKSTARLKEELSKLRTGRGDPGVYENIHVTLDKASKATVPLKDLANVVMKGRVVAVTVYEADNVKKVFSAIQKANLNVQPLEDAKNPLLLNIPIPPPTKEARTQTVEQASKIGDKAQMALRNARSASHKKLKALKGERPDDIRKADKQLEKIMEKAGVEVKKIIDAAKKAIGDN